MHVYWYGCTMCSKKRANWMSFSYFKISGAREKFEIYGISHARVATILRCEIRAMLRPGSRPHMAAGRRWHRT